MSTPIIDDAAKVFADPNRGDDTEFRRGNTPEEQLQVLLDFFGYFNRLTASRREHPTEDLASAIANARVDGEPALGCRHRVLLCDHRHRRPRHYQRNHRGRPAGADRKPPTSGSA